MEVDADSLGTPLVLAALLAYHGPNMLLTGSNMVLSKLSKVAQVKSPEVSRRCIRTCTQMR